MAMNLKQIVAGVAAASAMGVAHAQSQKLETSITEPTTYISLTKQLQTYPVVSGDGTPVKTGYGGTLSSGEPTRTVRLTTFDFLETQQKTLAEFFNGTPLQDPMKPYIQRGVHGAIEGLKRNSYSGITYNVGTGVAPIVPIVGMVVIPAALGAFSAGSTAPAAAAPPACFTGETKVVMADGSLKQISSIQVGDSVQSFSFENNMIVNNKVKRLFSVEAPSLLKVNGLNVTSLHPFAIGHNEWTEAGNLNEGDSLVAQDGSSIAVEKIEKIDSRAQVYDLTVSNDHNFFVNNGAETILVHNKGAFGCFIEGSNIKMADESVTPIENIKIGDKVKAFDLDTQQWKEVPVTEVQSFRKSSSHFLINNKLRVSPYHYLFVNGAWKTAPQLSVNDALANENKENIPVVSIQTIDQKADKHNIVLGRNRRLLYSVDGVMVWNGW